MFNRIYISFHDGKVGLTGVNLKILIPGATPGADVFRDAAGLAPTAGSGIGAANGAAGKVNSGVYQIAVVYETTSGFLTPPGPKISGVFTPTSYTAPGSLKINLTNIPVGPTGTAKRRILITKAGLAEYFLLGSTYGGIIADNTTTTATLDFDDTVNLVASADYLFDLRETVKAGVALQDYNSRLCVAGDSDLDSTIKVSLAGDIESFDLIDGIKVVSNKDDGFLIRNLSVTRDVLYAWRTVGAYSVRDNGDVPSTWPDNPIDNNVNVPVHGIAEFFSVSGIRMVRDWTLLVDRSGILLFDGVVRKPPLTDNINDLWQIINADNYHRAVLAVDDRLHKIYCAIPTESSTENDIMLAADYNSCPGKIPDLDKIKWSIWEPRMVNGTKRPSQLGMISLYGSPFVGVKEPTLHFGSIDGGGKIWKLDPNAITDDGISIPSFWETSFISWVLGDINIFAAARFRITGGGTLLTTVTGEDGILASIFPAITVTSAPGKEELVRVNFQNEKAKFLFGMESGTFEVSHVILYGKQMLQMRPA